MQNENKKWVTDFEALAAMTDDDIDCSDIPEMTDEEIENAPWFIEGQGKETIYFSVDDFVLDYFKKKGKNAYLVMMSDALKDYVIAQRKLEAEDAE